MQQNNDTYYDVSIYIRICGFVVMYLPGRFGSDPDTLTSRNTTRHGSDLRPDV
jgi:hypothetical protein